MPQGLTRLIDSFNLRGVRELALSRELDNYVNQLASQIDVRKQRERKVVCAFIIVLPCCHGLTCAPLLSSSPT